MNIEFIKKILSMKPSIYIGEGIISEFGAQIKEKNPINRINELENYADYILPDEYKKFLLECDGIQFTTGSELTLYGISEIIRLNKYIDFISGIIPIGYCMEEYIVINCNDICSGKYIYAGDAYCSDEYYSLDCTFNQFLERYIISNLNNYWTWFKSEKRYKFVNA